MGNLTFTLARTVMLTTFEDWTLYYNCPGAISPRTWEENARKEHPILEKYFARDQIDLFVTTAALLGLSYKQYISDHATNKWHPTLDLCSMYPAVMDTDTFNLHYMGSFNGVEDET